MTERRDPTNRVTCVAVRTLNESLQQEHLCSWVEGGSVTDINNIKMLLGIGVIIMALGVAGALYGIHCLIGAIRDLHSDISVIRLDNSRTMAELRRRHR
jgi:hypothetical protein